MKILNFGSLNQDYIYRVKHIVEEGETIAACSLETRPGGKGLNQSVALSRAGAGVSHAGMIGEDGAGLRSICEGFGINTDFIKTGKLRTGNAMIQVDDSGHNSIVLYSGANYEITESMMDEVLSHFDAGDVLLLQNEINGTDKLIKKASDRKLKIVLNPSPYDERIKKELLQYVYILFVNEVEGKQITGKSSPGEILDGLLEISENIKIVLTLGEKGAYYADAERRFFQPAVKVDTVDTTGAGDTFTGYFLQGYFSDGAEIPRVLKRAACASALAVRRRGAADAVPVSTEVEAFIREQE